MRVVNASLFWCSSLSSSPSFPRELFFPLPFGPDWKGGSRRTNRPIDLFFFFFFPSASSFLYYHAATRTTYTHTFLAPPGLSPFFFPFRRYLEGKARAQPPSAGSHTNKIFKTSLMRFFKASKPFLHDYCEKLDGLLRSTGETLIFSPVLCICGAPTTTLYLIVHLSR